MRFDIREAAASDYERLCVLFDEGDARHRKNLPRVFQATGGAARDRDYVLDLIADETVGFFVADLGDRLAGVISVMIKASPAMPIFVRRRYAVVDNVVVTRKLHRTGIGQALMERAHAWALAEGAESIELNVWEFNQQAIKFYTTLGYEAISRKMSQQLHQEMT